MKTKNLLLLWVLLAIAIIVASSNNFQLAPGTKISLPDSARGNALFVCPAADAGFDSVAQQMQDFMNVLPIVFTFFGLLWLAITGWVLYQSLLKDKFEKKSYDLPIFLGKFLLFAFVLVTIALKTPNYFRTVYVAGTVEKWVLCESDTPGAKAVRIEALSSGAKQPAK